MILAHPHVIHKQNSNYQHDTCTSTCDFLQMHPQIVSFIPMGEAVGGTRQNFIAMFHYY